MLREKGLLLELDLPCREGVNERGKGGWSGSTISVTVAGQRRTSLGRVTGFPHCAPRVRAAGAPLPGY